VCLEKVGEARNLNCSSTGVKLIKASYFQKVIKASFSRSAENYAQKGRTVECPNLRFAPVSLELPLIEIE
jgi:hypothetical protein